MHTIIDLLKRDIGKASSVGGIVDAAHDVARRAGFDAMIYDFSPVATTPEGTLVIPSHLSHREAPADMRQLWCEQKYHQHDPVQQIALKTSAPFVWSYRQNGRHTALASHLKKEHEPVTAYLHDTNLTCGITVPLHRSTGGFATFTVIQKDAGPSFIRDTRDVLQSVGLMGQIMHDAALPHLATDQTQATIAALTPREAECLHLSAQGHTAKEIADQIGRSVPTATLHLKSATAKLRARNRAHAVALALHYRLIEL
ncbi:helix-turn-helix transcriptional regulator [Sedimentitalea nanhaiensis]|uniref:LuxR family transcriptional regulator n=1 Tax=Sedimentitalea nanhaiensis TaxID=999627 RepID=A0A1I7BUN4_9RHOB|nr:LuxR family transcriptional regulator [Sedimentitalea nanhaiensis]SFT90898.1 LuxR family transcriptional regulator [Sedimentitalea nanhaiensis]